MKKFLLIIIIFTSFLSLFFSLVPILSGCDDSTGPPNNNNKFNLKLEDVSCTEAQRTFTNYLQFFNSGKYSLTIKPMKGKYAKNDNYNNDI